MSSNPISEEIMKELEEIQKKVYSGELSLINYELVPYFHKLKDSLTTNNLNSHSKAYMNACSILEQKFEELKNIISSSDIEKKFLIFLQEHPQDDAIIQLFNGAWKKPFFLKTVSNSFLDKATDLLCRVKEKATCIQHEEFSETNVEFIIEVLDKDFTEKMMFYYESIKTKLPCSFNEIFEEETNQLRAYKNFVYLMHLLQSGIVNYQKETNFLYI